MIMDLPQSTLKLRYLAGVLGIIQGLTWTIMSLICIILYFSERITSQPTTYIDSIGFFIYQFIIYHDVSLFPGQILTSGTFAAFMFIHFTLNVTWTGYSVYLLRKNNSRVLKQWGYFTTLICVWDFITFVILGADYDACLGAPLLGSTMEWEIICANTILPVFVIAAKGFTLWIINGCLAWMLIRTSKQVT